MATVQEMVDRLKAFDVEKEVVQIYARHSDDYLEAQKSSLWDGKDREGKSIHPSYLEDPFFKTQKQAIGYAKWKKRITPNPQRSLYDPNLFINGYFYSTLKFQADVVPFITVDNSFGSQIFNKYPDAMGVGKEKSGKILGEQIHPEFMAVFEQKTGLKAG